MAMNELAVTIGLISLPGLIAAILSDKLVVHTARWEIFKYSIYTFVFGVGSYGVLQMLSSAAHALNCHLPFLVAGKPTLETWTVLTTSGAKPILAEIAWAAALAPLLALLAIQAVNRKWLNRLAQKARVSAKYGDENLYSYYLNLNVVNWVYVRDIANNLSYRGQIYSFSETPALQELVLNDVTVYSYLESEELYQVPMIYLSRPLGALLIEAAPDPSNGSNGNEERDQRGHSPNPGEGRSTADDQSGNNVEPASASTAA